MHHNSVRLVLVALSLLAISAAPTPSRANADECKQVQGHQVETPLPGSSCASPVGLCTVAELSGALKGEALFTASEIISNSDTQFTQVVFVIGDSIIKNAQLGGKRGTLTVKNAAAFRTAGDNDLVDVQTILGGTADFAGATGSLRIRGNFDPESGGTSTFEGVVCVP